MKIFQKKRAITNIVDFGCCISNNLKLAVFNCAKEMICKSLMLDIYNVSNNTVQSIFDEIFYKDTVYKNFLPFLYKLYFIAHI